jgi:hypothetical protein
MKFWITVVAVFALSFGAVAAFKTPTASTMPDRQISRATGLFSRPPSES